MTLSILCWSSSAPTFLDGLLLLLPPVVERSVGIEYDDGFWWTKCGVAPVTAVAKTRGKGAVGKVGLVAVE